MRTATTLYLLLAACGCVGVARDPDAADRLLNRPASRCPASPTFVLDRPTTVPLSMPFGLPTVAVLTGGRERSFLIDSGSQFCLLRPEIVEELDLPVSGLMRLSLLGETIDSRTTCLHDFSVGELRCGHIPFVVTPGHVARSFLGVDIETIDGVLGMPFLRHVTTTFDFSRNEIHFSPAAPLAIQPGDAVHVIPLSFLSDGRPCVRVAIGESTSRLFLFDTGSRPCLVERALARELRLRPLEQVRLLGLGVELTATLTQLPELALGDVLLTKVRAYILPEKEAHLLAKVDGLLGIDALKAFVVTIDLAGKQLIIVES